MRLLNSTTYELSYFMAEKDIPHYAILSHTWEGGEVSLQDLQNAPIDEKSMKGWYKIQKCCEQGIVDGYEWVWVDSCCIDKTSSAELSEAINSMFRWYGKAHICYAYLADVPSVGAGIKSSIMDSRWFTRGWTLQELIAPANIEFYDQNWQEIGTKCSLATELSKTTTIPVDVLFGQKSHLACLAGQRFSWSAHRYTSRAEDAAYCLLGIFDINMPLLYGGGWKAFYRLQEQILKSTGDLSLLLWSADDREQEIEEDVFLSLTPSHFRPLLYKTLQNSGNQLSRADWSQVSNGSQGSKWSQSRSVDSITITGSRLRVELPQAFSYEELNTTLLWTHQVLYSMDRSSILGMICIQIFIPGSSIGPTTRICNHLWLIPGAPPGISQWQSYTLMSLPERPRLSLSINESRSRKLCTSQDLQGRAVLNYIPSLEHPWDQEEVSISPAGACIGHHPHGTQVYLVCRIGNVQDPPPRLYFFAHLRLRIKMLSDGIQIDVMLSLLLTPKLALCRLVNKAEDDNREIDSLRPVSLFGGNSDRDEVHILGTDFIVKAAAKLRSNIVEYQISVHKLARTTC